MQGNGLSDEEVFGLEPSRKPSFGARAMASIPFTPNKVFRMLESQWGQGNVRVLGAKSDSSTVSLGDDGRPLLNNDGRYAFQVRDPGKGWVDFDSKNWSDTFGSWDEFSKDALADQAGLGIEIAPSMLARYAVIPQAASMAGGNILRQAVSEALPGGPEDMSMRDRAISAATSAALGGGIVGATKIGQRLFGPKTILARETAGANAGAVREGEEAAAILGVDPTLGQVTRSQFVRDLESQARGNSKLVDFFAERDRLQTSQALATFNKIVNEKIGTVQGGPAVASQLLASWNKLKGPLFDARERATIQGFRDIQASARNPLPTPALSAKLQEIASRFGRGEAGAVERDAAAGKLQELAQLLRGGSPSVTEGIGRRAQRAIVEQRSFQPSMSYERVGHWLTQLSQVARGRQKLLPNASDDLNADIAIQLTNALEQDIQRRIIESTSRQQFYNKLAMVSPAEGARLGAVWNEWKAKTRNINELLRGHVLGRIVGGRLGTDPKQVFDSLRAMQPEEIRAFMKILKEQAPETVQSLKAQLLDDAIRPASMFADDSLETMLARMPEKDRLAAFLEPGEMKEVARAVDAIKTLVREPLPTTPFYDPRYVPELQGAGPAFRRARNASLFGLWPALPSPFRASSGDLRGIGAGNVFWNGLAQWLYNAPRQGVAGAAVAVAPGWVARALTQPARRKALIELGRLGFWWRTAGRTATPAAQAAAQERAQRLVDIILPEEEAAKLAPPALPAPPAFPALPSPGGAGNAASGVAA